MLPERFFNSRASPATACPETALMYAVLEDAFLCFQSRFEIKGQSVERPAQEAEEWFSSADSHSLFSFVSICTVLGLDPEVMRRRLKHGMNPAWTGLQRKAQRVPGRR
jgi:hypothetical protein